jgi:hypothetical protein
VGGRAKGLELALGIGAGLDPDVVGLLENKFFLIFLDVDASGKSEVLAAITLSG